MKKLQKMKTLELTTQEFKTKSDFVPSNRIAETAAQSIYDDYFAIKPFDNQTFRALTVSKKQRVYFNHPEEYREYIEEVAKHLLLKLNLKPNLNP